MSDPKDKKSGQAAENPALAAAYAMREAAEQMIAALEGGKPGKRAPMVPAKGTETALVPVVAAPPPKPLTLRERIANALMNESLDTNKLSKSLGEPMDVVAAELASARAEGMVTNIGYDDEPLWVWRPGDSIDTPTLKKMVRRLLTERPMWIKDLIKLTGARASRVDGVMTELKRTERLGDAAGGMGRPGRPEAKMYYIPSASWKFEGEATDASLPARPTTRAGRVGKGIKPRAKHTR